MKDWLPSGENKDDYPDPETTSDMAWAWEYLRRNLEFQKACSDLDAFAEQHNIHEIIKNVRTRTNLKSGDYELVMEYYENCRKLDKQFKTKIAGHRHPDISLGFYQQHFLMSNERIKPGFLIYDHPEKNNSFYSFGTDMIPFIIDMIHFDHYKKNEETEIEIKTEPMNLLISINLRSSIKEQFEVAKKFSTSLQQKLNKMGLVKKRNAINGEITVERLRAHDIEFHSRLKGQEDYKVKINKILFQDKIVTKDDNRNYVKDVDNRLYEAKKFIEGKYKELI
ncbi:hypothetical protein [Desulfomarina sp.]